MQDVNPVVTSSKDVLGGTPVFAGTRVPVQTLFDYLADGESIDSFLEGFPSVRREQVLALLSEAKEHTLQRYFPGSKGQKLNTKGTKVAKEIKALFLLCVLGALRVQCFCFFLVKKLAVDRATSRRRRRELSALEDCFRKFQFGVGKRTWSRADLHVRS